MANDLISRQTAINALFEWECDNKDERDAIDVVNGLPSVELSTNLAEVGTDLISRQQAIDAVNCVTVMKGIRSGKSATAEAVDCAKRIIADNIRQLPPIQPDNNLQKLADEIASFKWRVKSDNGDYLTGYLCALSVVEGMIADMREDCEKE